MHYDLTNALASFQHFMSDVFEDPLVVYIVAYLGTILIYSEYLAAHTVHVLKPLRRPRANNLYAKIDKCAFDVENNLIGSIISPDGLQIHGAKVQVSWGRWPQPKEVRRVQSLLASLTRFVVSSQSIWR